MVNGSDVKAVDTSKIFPKSVLAAFEKQRTSGVLKTKDPEKIPCICRIFMTFTGATWYLYDYNPKTGIAEAYCNLGNPEWAEYGFVDVWDLLSMSTGFRSLERDRNFPTGKIMMGEIARGVKTGEW